MKNKILLIFLVNVVGVLLTSCYKDDTTIGGKEVSKIDIVSTLDVINVEVRQELIFSPEITQTIEDSNLKYEWAIGDYNSTTTYPVGDTLVVISEEPELKYTFNKLGRYALRLKVTNEFGGEVKLFELNVVTPYEEGIMVLSENQDGLADISFLKTLTPEEIAEGKTPLFETNVFSRLNPQYTINNAVDIDKVHNKIVITSSEGEMFKMDAKTLDLLSVLEVDDQISGMPVSLESFDYYTSYSTAFWDKNYVLCDDGKVYGYNPNVDIIFDSKYFYGLDGFDKSYSKIKVTVSSSGRVSKVAYHFFIDYDESIIATPGARDIYLSGNLFAGYDIVNMVCDDNAYAYVIAKDKTNPSNVRITKVRQFKFYSPEHYTYSPSNLTLTKESVMLVSNQHNYIYYSSGNNIYRWGYGIGVELPSMPEVTIDEGKVLTCMEMSPDNTRLYVGVYDPNSDGMKGSIYVYDAGAGMTLIEKYEGIAEKPIKVFYKEK